MPTGNWTCSSCRTTITELPFEPRSTDNLLCRDCHAKKRSSGNMASRNGGEKTMFEGNWKCADCGNSITKLPFKPRETSGLKCIDCFKKSRA